MHNAESNGWAHEPCVPYNILSNKRMNERSSIHVLLFSCLKHRTHEPCVPYNIHVKIRRMNERSSLQHAEGMSIPLCIEH